MKNFKSITVLTILYLVFYSSTTKAQSISEKKDTIISIRTADNLVSGNTKDVLTSFFQLAFNDLTGPDKEFKFTTSIFALKLKTNPALNISQQFMKQKFARNTDINWAINLDSNFRFGGFSVGVKYALLNMRDYNASNRFISEVMDLLTPYTNAKLHIVAEISKIDDAAKMAALNLEYDSLSKGTKSYRFASEMLKAIIKDAVDMEYGDGILPYDSFFSATRGIYNNVRSTYATKPLIVAGIDAKTFKDQVLFSDINLYIDGTGGIVQLSSARFDFDLVGKVTLDITNDSVTTSKDLNRSTVHAEAGVNMSFRNKVQMSTLELKATASYTQVLKGLYLGEKENVFTLNGTLRTRITKDIFIPIIFNFNPVSGKVLATISVGSNFDWLNKLLRS